MEWVTDYLFQPEQETSFITSQCMQMDSSIWITGSDSVIGRSLTALLSKKGFDKVLSLSNNDPTLITADKLEKLFQKQPPEYIFEASGVSAGIAGNVSRPAELIFHNLTCTTQLINLSFKHKAKKLLYLGSSCCYPANGRQPLTPDQLWAGPLEPTNQAYATAKLAGIEMCRAYRKQYGCCNIAGIPSNPYGNAERLDPEDMHVIDALMLRIKDAKELGLPAVSVWGTGTPRRDFIHADDVASACFFLMENYDGSEPINIGSNEDISIADLAHMIQAVSGYSGKLEFDSSKPDGMPLKMLDAIPLRELGWKPKISLEDGLKRKWVSLNPPL